MTIYRQRLHSATNDTHVISGPPNFPISLSNIVGGTIDSTKQLVYFTGFREPNIVMVYYDPNNVAYSVLNIFIRRVDKIAEN